MNNQKQQDLHPQTSSCHKILGLVLALIFWTTLTTQPVMAGSNNPLFNCTFGDPAAPQTFTITAQDLGATTTSNSLSATGAVQTNLPPAYQVQMNLYQYRCACPDVNQPTCGGPGDGDVCTLQTQVVINQGSATATTTIESGCATLQSDVNLGGVLVRRNNGSWMPASCTGNATLSPEKNQISAHAAYLCVPPPTSTPTNTPASPPPVTPTLTPTPPATPTPTLTPIPPVLTSTSYWQVYSGLVLTKLNLVSALPFKLPANNPPNFLIKQYPLDTINSAGLLQIQSTTPSSLNLGQGQITERSPDQRMSQVRGHQETACQKFTFSYFQNKLLTSAQRSVLANVARANTTLNDLDQVSWLPPLPDSTQVAFYRGSVTINPASTWEVANKKYVILVDGDVVIADPNALSSSNQALLTIAETGFFGIIASGQVVFDSNVGRSTPSATVGQPVLSGLYLAYGNLEVKASGSSSTEKQFVGSGSFIGCQNVLLPRSFGDDPGLANIPSDQFIYRPSLILSAPKALSDLQLTWREIL